MAAHRPVGEAATVLATVFTVLAAVSTVLPLIPPTAPCPPPTSISSLGPRRPL